MHPSFGHLFGDQSVSTLWTLQHNNFLFRRRVPEWRMRPTQIIKAIVKTTPQPTHIQAKQRDPTTTDHNPTKTTRTQQLHNNTKNTKPPQETKGKGQMRGKLKDKTTRRVTWHVSCFGILLWNLFFAILFCRFLFSSFSFHLLVSLSVFLSLCETRPLSLYLTSVIYKLIRTQAEHTFAKDTRPPEKKICTQLLAHKQWVQKLIFRHSLIAWEKSDFWGKLNNVY